MADVKEAYIKSKFGQVTFRCSRENGIYLGKFKVFANETFKGKSLDELVGTIKDRTENYLKDKSTEEIDLFIENS